MSQNATWKVLLIEAGDSENYAMDIPITTQFLQLSYVNWKYKSLPSHFAFKGMLCFFDSILTHLIIYS